MKISDNLGPDHAAIVARDRAIVARETARLRTTDSTRVRTTDPAHSQMAWKGSGRFRDTVLHAEPAAHNPNMVHRAWGGNLKAELKAMSATDRAKALDHLRSVLDDFASSIDDDPEALGSGATPESVDAANKAFWDGANKRVTRDATPRDATQARLQEMQRAQDEFWAKATAHQRTPAKEWGKG